MKKQVSKLVRDLVFALCTIAVGFGLYYTISMSKQKVKEQIELPK